MLILFHDDLKAWPKITDRSDVILSGPTATPMTGFDSDEELKTGMVHASRGNTELAKKFAIENIKARGGTDINKAVKVACQVLHHQAKARGNMILFLADRYPSSRETRPGKIVENVADAAESTEDSGQVAIHSLGFGSNLNYHLIEKISLKTEGKVKRIYKMMPLTC